MDLKGRFWYYRPLILTKKQKIIAYYFLIIVYGPKALENTAPLYNKISICIFASSESKYPFMKLQCWSIGKPNEQYVKTGVDDFTKRISHYFPVEWFIIPSPKHTALNPPDIRKKESEMVLNYVKKDDCLVVLDERGKQWSSEGLAAFIQSKANESTKQIVFLIGGAYGLDETVMKRADFTWSLSQLVFPHQLVRLILSEQLYRACTIIRNEKYHHS